MGKSQEQLAKKLRSMQLAVGRTHRSYMNISALKVPVTSVDSIRLIQRPVIAYPDFRIARCQPV